MPSIKDLTVMVNYGLTVYEHYIGADKVKINRKIISPLRPERDPSFNIYVHGKTGEYWFKDHGIDIVGNHWQFVMEKFGIDFKDAVAKVKEDIISGNSAQPLIPSYKKDYVVKERPIVKTEIFPQFRVFNSKDLNFFSNAMISKETLHLFNVEPATNYVLKKTEGSDVKQYTIYETEDSPIYIFTFPSGRVKVYRPMEIKGRKWMSNLKAEEDIFGSHLLPYSGKDAFLLAGNRDTMAFYENIGIPCFALPSESANLAEEFHHQLSVAFRNVWVLYDNDNQGYKKAMQFREDYGFSYLNDLFKEFNVNDFCDLTENHKNQVESFKEKLFSVIRNISN